MGYPRHLYLTFGGRFFDIEAWSGGIRLASPAEPNDESDDAWIQTAESQVEAAAELVRLWFVNPASNVMGTARLDWVKLNAIGEDGRYLDEGNTSLVEYPQDTAPTPPGGFDWPQVATVVSFRTDVTRGLAARGRLYVPTAVGKSGAGRIAGADQVEMLEPMRDLLEGLRDLPQLLIGGQLAPCVVSRGRQTSPGVYGPGIARYIRRVEVGNVQDTQRRRRDQLPEVYEGLDVDPDD
jgi:hypothetical protein